jgi:hypothetical protein
MILCFWKESKVILVMTLICRHSLIARLGDNRAGRREDVVEKYFLVGIKILTDFLVSISKIGTYLFPTATSSFWSTTLTEILM